MSQTHPPHDAVRTIAVTSGKGGVGKSTLAVNLALTWARRGRRVLLVDGDLALANAHILLGRGQPLPALGRPTRWMPHGPPSPTLADVLLRGVPAEDAIWPARPGLWLLPAGSGLAELTQLGPRGTHRLLAAIGSVVERYDVVLVDTPAGIGEAAMLLASACRDVVLVTTPEPTAVADAYATLKVLSLRWGVRRVHLVVNRVHDDGDGTELFARLGAVAGRFLPVLLTYGGAIAEDARIRTAVMRQQPVVELAPDSVAVTAIAAVVSRIEVQHEPVSPAGRVQFHGTVGHTRTDGPPDAAGRPHETTVVEGCP